MLKDKNTGEAVKGNQDKKPADAWGNIMIIDAQGNEYPVTGSYVPIEADKNQVHRSLFQCAKANGGELVVTAKLTVRVAAVDDGSTIQF